MATLNPPREVVKLAERLRRAGHEAWCVGGAVRDALLGHEHLDWDIATSATPQEVQQLFRRTVPVGVEFGTVGVVDGRGVMHEVTTFRKDVRTDGRHAEVEFGVSLDDDLARRDFTINAIAYDPITGELRDPFDGRTDLTRGVVRAVGNADERMREDRLRALRAIRFAARFGFHIEPATWAAIKASAPFLHRLSAERVKQELEKTMQQVAHASVALEWWRESGALAALVPLLATAPEERFRALDFLPSGATVAGAAAQRGGARAAVGDGASTEAGATAGAAADGVAGGADRVARPDAKGATLTRLAMLFFGDDPADVERATRALKFSNADVAWIVALARARRDVGRAVQESFEGDAWREPGGRGALRRWIAAVGRVRTDAFCALFGAEQLARAARPDGATGEWGVPASLRERLDAFRRAAGEVAFNDPIELADLAVDGEDLARAGVPAGPAMGRMLRRLMQRVIDDPSLNTPQRLSEMAREEMEKERDRGHGGAGDREG